MKNVPQKQVFQFIGWLVVLDFCGWRSSIRTEEGRYSIWQLTIQRLNPLVKLHQTRKNQAESNSSAVNPPAVTQPGLQRQSRSQTGHAQAQAKEDQYRQEQEKRQVEEVDRQLKEAQLLLGAQNRRLSTITEVAITIFVLLCGVGVAVFLRVKRQIATPTSYR